MAAVESRDRSEGLEEIVTELFRERFYEYLQLGLGYAISNFVLY